jgi:hypothetical protein
MVEAFAKLPARAAVLDGELCLIGPGKASCAAAEDYRHLPGPAVRTRGRDPGRAHRLGHGLDPRQDAGERAGAK